LNEELGKLVVYLIDQHDCKFMVDDQLNVILESEQEGFPHFFVGRIYNIISFINIINNYILYIHLDFFPVSFEQTRQSKYLNLLNLVDAPSHLDLTLMAMSANQSMYNKIKYLDKMNLIDTTLANRKRSFPPLIENSISKFNNNNKSQEKIGNTKANSSLDSKANSKANSSSLKIMISKVDSQEEIKDALKTERRKTIRSERIVLTLKQKIEEHSRSNGLASYFPRDWYSRNLSSVRRMRRYIDPEFILKAIDWFFTDKWWRGKITDIHQIEKHYNKFVSANRGAGVSGGLIAQRLKELNK
jgi:hypothetical protein